MTVRTITFDDEQWQVVPREPTEDMLLRGYSALMAWDARTGDDYGILEVFLAMLAAAPEPPAQQPMADDTQRLDHLIQTGAFRVFSADINGNHTWIGLGRPIGEGGTVRDAIDDSIKRRHGTGKGESNA